MSSSGQTPPKRTGKTAGPDPRVPRRRGSDRWEGHRQERRRQMAEAAVRAIRRLGPRVSMDDIAAEAGVSKPIVYRQFEHKADLYLLIARQTADRLLVELSAELEGDHEPQAHVAAVIDAYLRFIEAEPQLYRFLVSRAFLDTPLHADPVTDFASAVGLAVGRQIGERLRAAGLDSGGAEAWGYGLVGYVERAAAWWLDRQTMSREALRDYLSALVWNGFAGLLAGADQPRGPAADAAAPDAGVPDTPVPDAGGRGRLRPVPGRREELA
jgi:AcrR family transcriptional regulator